MHLQVFLQEFFAKIETAECPSNDICPKGKVEKGEIVIGSLNGELKKVWALKLAMEKDLDAKIPMMRGFSRDMYLEKATGEMRATLRNYALECRRMSIVDDIFWQMVRESLFDPKMAVEKPAIDIRENWQVVTVPKRSAMPDCIGVMILPVGGKECKCPVCTALRQQDQGPKNPGA